MSAIKFHANMRKIFPEKMFFLENFDSLSDILGDFLKISKNLLQVCVSFSSST